MDAGIHTEEERCYSSVGMMDSGVEDDGRNEYARCSIEVGMIPPESAEARVYALALLDRVYMEMRRSIDV